MIPLLRPMQTQPPDFLFYSPVGELHERKAGVARPKGWVNASPYAVLYRRGTPLAAYHTGVDYNKNTPVFDADAHSPVYSCSGTEKHPSVVTYAQRFSPNWGWIVIARHYVTPTTFVYARYAHLENVRVKVGDLIYWDTQIGNVGRIDINSPFHCHFDISPTDVLFRSPGDWPKLNRNYLLVHYLDPERFIAEHGGQDMAEKMRVTAPAGVGLYVNPRRLTIPAGGEVMGYETLEVDGNLLRRVQTLDVEDDGWVIERLGTTQQLEIVDVPESVTVNVAKLTVRVKPGTNNAITLTNGKPTYVFQGNVFQVSGTYMGAGAREWTRIVSGPLAGNYVARVGDKGETYLLKV